MTAVSAGLGKVMTLPSVVTAKVCVTAAAATKVALPGWFAVIEHVPEVSSVTLLPATVQIAAVLLA